MLHQIVFEYWSPSKEIRHQIDMGQSYDALWSLKGCLHRNYQEYYLDELKLFQPHTFEDFFPNVNYIINSSLFLVATG